MVPWVTPATKPFQNLYPIEPNLWRWLPLSELHLGGVHELTVDLYKALDSSKVLVCVAVFLLMSATGQRRGEM